MLEYICIVCIYVLKFCIFYIYMYGWVLKKICDKFVYFFEIGIEMFW